MNVQPDNDRPILMCEGQLKCGPIKHVFSHCVRSKKVAMSIRQIFACSRCDAERTWGLVDAAQVKEILQ